MPPLYFDTESAQLIDINHIHDEPPAGAQLLGKLVLDVDFPYTRGDFPRRSLNEWGSDEIIAIGQRVIADLAAYDSPIRFTRSIAERLHILGLFIDPKNGIGKNKQFQTFADLVTAIDTNQEFHVRHNGENSRYHLLSCDELAHSLITVRDSMIEPTKRLRHGAPLTSSTIEILNQLGLSPSEDYIISRFGGIGQLNESLGFPDTHHWDEHDFISYGAQVLQLNGPNSMTQDNITWLSKQNLGPSVKAILNRFNWQQFQDLAYEELHNQIAKQDNHKKAVEQYYQKHVDSTNQGITFQEKAQHRALWLLLGHYMKRQDGVQNLPKRLDKNSVDNAIRAILEKSPHITNAEIESLAITLGIFDDLWPLVMPHRHPPLLAKKL